MPANATSFWDRFRPVGILKQLMRPELSTATFWFFALTCILHSEPFREHYHFSPQRNWINDPNGLVFFEGEYHLFFQYNPYGDTWGHMSWGHAVSPDLVHWTELPVALPETNGLMAFSGSAVVDWNNTSGFGLNGKPPLVAIYTGHRAVDGLQAQCLAWSNDRGRTWNLYAGNPVIDIGSKNFRDPKVFWHAPTQHWVMVVALSDERRIVFYCSPDLKTWERTGAFGPAASVAGAWECPDLFPLAITDRPGRQAWVLVVNTGNGSPAGGSGTQYFIGDFNGREFNAPTLKNQGPLWADYGKDCYAAVSWSDIPKQDGRRIWLGWMNNWTYASDTPTSGWRGTMTLPRQLTLRSTPLGVRLCQTPVNELQKLRSNHHVFREHTIEALNHWISRHYVGGDSLEIQMELQPDHTGQCGLRLRKGTESETLLGYDEASGRVFVDRTHSGNVSFHKEFPGLHHALLAHPGTLKFRVFVDAASIEVFVNDGELVFTEQIFPAPDAVGCEGFVRASGAQVARFECWTLKSLF